MSARATNGSILGTILGQESSAEEDVRNLILIAIAGGWAFILIVFILTRIL